MSIKTIFNFGSSACFPGRLVNQRSLAPTSWRNQNCVCETLEVFRQSFRIIFSVNEVVAFCHSSKNKWSCHNVTNFDTKIRTFFDVSKFVTSIPQFFFDERDEFFVGGQPGNRAERIGCKPSGCLVFPKMKVATDDRADEAIH